MEKGNLGAFVMGVAVCIITEVLTGSAKVDWISVFLKRSRAFLYSEPCIDVSDIYEMLSVQIYWLVKVSLFVSTSTTLILALCNVRARAQFTS